MWSYAVLALLALQPWTTYQLATQMERSLGWIWPPRSRRSSSGTRVDLSMPRWVAIMSSMV